MKLLVKEHERERLSPYVALHALVVLEVFTLKIAKLSSLV